MSSAKKQMRVTQRDIARLSKVSQATVSRVLAGDDRVDILTSERVKQVMREHNYRPDVLARSLRSRRSGLIGLVVKRPAGGLHDDPFFANLASEIMDFLSSTPYHLCMEMVTDRTQEAVYDELLRARRVDGLILVESEARDERIQRLQADRFPFVLIGNPDEIQNADELDRPWSVDNDNAAAGELAAKHLVDSGFKKIGILAGPPAVTVSEDRIEGYRRAIAGKQDRPLIWHSDFGLSAAKDTAISILCGDDRPDALVVLDDFMAMGVVLAARVCHAKIPDDLALVSFNDSSLCHVLDCGLTSTSLNIREIVQVACGRLLRIIEDKPVAGERRVIVPTQLKVRGSSLPSRGLVNA